MLFIKRTQRVSLFNNTLNEELQARDLLRAIHPSSRFGSTTHLKPNVHNFPLADLIRHRFPGHDHAASWKTLGGLQTRKSVRACVMTS
jgi:hypothetical protein